MQRIITELLAFQEVEGEVEALLEADICEVEEDEDEDEGVLVAHIEGHLQIERLYVVALDADEVEEGELHKYLYCINCTIDDIQS